MKAKRLLFLVMVICLASGVKAQFYDSADDVYFYIMESEGSSKSIYSSEVMIFNFDGRKACYLAGSSVNTVKSHIKENPDYYVEKEENSDYDMKYESSSYGTRYIKELSERDWNSFGGFWITRNVKYTFDFSSDRNSLRVAIKVSGSGGGHSESKTFNHTYKKVDKSYFKVGRSRTPSGSLYE